MKSSPPRPELVVTPLDPSRGQDLLGLRAPAERIAVGLMDGVTTVSPLIRYLGFRAWVIRRYTDLRGPDSRSAFDTFAGKCETALVLGHKLAGVPTVRMVGGDRASELLSNGAGPVAKRLTKILAMEIYAGPSQDLGLAIRRRPVPSLSTERGLPLAGEVDNALREQPTLMTLDLTSPEQPLSAEDLIGLADAFPISEPRGAERSLLVDSISPPKPRPGEFARVVAYGYLLHMASQLAVPLDEEAVFRDAILGSEGVPAPLRSVSDGWLRFLVRDLLVAAHERAAQAVLGMLDERPFRTGSVDRLLHEIGHFEIGRVLEQIGLTGMTAATPIGDLYNAVGAACEIRTTRGSLSRWSGSLDELSVIEALQANPGPDVLALLPVAWILAVLRAGAGLGDPKLSVDALSGASLARLGLHDVITPTVSEWRGSSEPVGQVVARLARRSIDQHLLVAWFRMQADPRRTVALLISDGQTWTADGAMRAGRATSRLYQAISWLHQLGLVADDGITPDGAMVLERTLRLIDSPGRQP